MYIYIFFKYTLFNCIVTAAAYMVQNREGSMPSIQTTLTNNSLLAEVMIIIFV